MTQPDEEHASKFRDAVHRMAVEPPDERHPKRIGMSNDRLKDESDERGSSLSDKNVTLSDALRASIASVGAVLLGSLPFFGIIFIAWLTGIAGDTKEIVFFSVAMAGFFITYALLVGFIETRWPSREKIRVGNYGLWPKKAAILFPVWLGVYIYIVALIVTLLFP